jgi:glutamine cyclotransferase
LKYSGVGRREMMGDSGDEGQGCGKSGETLEGAYEIIRTIPHDGGAFTQGIVCVGDAIFESTGLIGQSSVRQIQLPQGKIIQRCELPGYFGEGIVEWGDRILQLTWRSEIGFIYDSADLRRVETFRYRGEGWGITHNGEVLIMSDGTSQLRIIDPNGFKEIDRLEIRDGHAPIHQLNDLQWVRSEIYANVWRSSRIARICPMSGRVIAWLELKQMVSSVADVSSRADDCLNGIGYDPRNDRLFVTGKRWPKLFEIRLLI